jgi:alpha-glucosidase
MRHPEDAALLHPTVPPWQGRHADGLGLVLLTDAMLAGEAFVRTMPDNEESLVPMRRVGRSGAAKRWQRWEAEIAWDTGNGLTLYAFALAGPEHEGGWRWLAADGEHASLPPEALMFRVHRHERPPEWVREQVFYQVFPDRFARGLNGGRPSSRHGEILHGPKPQAVRQLGWETQPTREHGAHSFWGGDLVGLRQRLPELHDELGITALYLNPVFAAGSNHRYDTIDYTQVCPHLGGNAALVELRQATRERGMRLVLDAVVNHTGVDHPWFDLHGRHRAHGLGAAQGPESPKRGWYAFDEHGSHLGWKGVRSLPVLDFAHPGVQQAVHAGEDAVLRHWLREPYGIDGWRLDVIHMLGEGPGAAHNAEHVRAIRRSVKAVQPEVYVLGEHFAEATRWLQGDMEDGAMNYHGFTSPLRQWLVGQEWGGSSARLSTAGLLKALSRSLAAIPYENQLAQFNLLSSHDTPRWLTLLGGDRARMQLAFTLLFAWPGVPCVYYGDEIGLEGGADPANRGPFPWERSVWDASLRTHVAALSRLRRERAEWRHGAWQSLAVRESGRPEVAANSWAFARCLGGTASLVLAHRGPAATLEIDTRTLPEAHRAWRLAVGSGSVEPGEGGLTLRVPAPGAWVLLSG